MVPWILIGYAFGSVPFAFLLARRAGIDVRVAGSGNVGAANVLRTTGTQLGVLVMSLDILKGVASVLLAATIEGRTSAMAAAGTAAIVGHIYPVWLRFKGGKGVATACGVFSVLTPVAVPPTLVAFILSVWGTKYISLGSIVASVVLPPIAYATGASSASVAAACTAAALIIFRHRSNVLRLLEGTERRLGVRV
jgi:acyl phosphate:glycerol-3-phosphate acyltransferase